ncbi:MAG: hypothetical protein K6G75_00550 [Lachnospiraceae bacterium]|nr:hypothetical protein [Lachnospiraceae bacterium]
MLKMEKNVKGYKKYKKRILSLFLVLSIIIFFVLLFVAMKYGFAKKQGFLIEADECCAANHVFEVSLIDNMRLREIEEDKIELKILNDRKSILEEGKDYYILTRSKYNWKLVFTQEGTYDLKFKAGSGIKKVTGTKSVEILYDNGITPIVIYDENYFIGVEDSTAEVTFANLSYSPDGDEIGNYFVEVFYDNNDDGECETEVLSEPTDDYCFSFEAPWAGKYSAVVSMEEILSEEVSKAYGKETVNSAHEEFFFEVRNENPVDNSCILFLDKPQLLVLYNDGNASVVNETVENVREIINSLGYDFDSSIVRISDSAEEKYIPKINEVLSLYKNSRNDLIVLNLCDLEDSLASSKERDVEKVLTKEGAEISRLSFFNSSELANLIINHQKKKAADKALRAGFGNDQTEFKPISFFSPVICFNKENTELQNYNSAQSMALSFDESYVFVMLIKHEKNEEEDYEIPTMIIYKKNEFGEYEELNTIYDLVYGHQNGATYYEKDGMAYVVIASPFYGKEYSLVRYGMNLDNGSIVSTDYIPLLLNEEFVRGIRSVTYDKNEAAFYVTDGSRLLRYDENFSNGKVIRSKGMDSYSPNGAALGIINIDQDGTVNGDCFYSVTYYPDQAAKYENMGLKNAEERCAADDTVIVVYDKKNGDFKKFIILNSKDIKKVTDKNYYKASENDMVEIEDVEFSDDKIFLLYQKNANFQILCADKAVFQNKRECEELTIVPLR